MLPVSAYIQSIVRHIHYKELTNKPHNNRYINLGKRKLNGISFSDKYVDYFMVCSKLLDRVPMSEDGVDVGRKL
jgi:hypothetical protein